MGRVGGIEVAFKSQQQLGFIFIEKNTACSQLLLTMEKQAKLQRKVKNKSYLIFTFIIAITTALNVTIITKNQFKCFTKK